MSNEIIDVNAIELPVELPQKKHVACVLLLDVSGSMDIERNGIKGITELNKGIRVFKEETLKLNGPTKSKAIDIAVITFGGEVKVEQSFGPINDMNIREFHAGGQTPMAEAIDMGLNLLRARKEDYKKNGTAYYRPWMVCITDGKPEGDDEEYKIEKIKSIIKEEEARKGVITYCFGVPGYDEIKMKEIFNKVFSIKSAKNIVELLQFLSRSVSNPTDTGEIEILDFDFMEQE